MMVDRIILKLKYRSFFMILSPMILSETASAKLLFRSGGCLKCCANVNEFEKNGTEIYRVGLER